MSIPLLCIVISFDGLLVISYMQWEALSGEFKQLEYLRKIIGNNEDTSSVYVTENEQ